MSVDPVVAAAQADLTALIDAEIAQLAADAQALRALLVEGAVVTARVLPSNGLTDLLEIAGRRVAASLPSTVRPGDVLQVQVTGFDGDRILLQVVGRGATRGAGRRRAGPGRSARRAACARGDVQLGGLTCIRRRRAVRAVRVVDRVAARRTAGRSAAGRAAAGFGDAARADLDRSPARRNAGRGRTALRRRRFARLHGAGADRAESRVTERARRGAVKPRKPCLLYTSDAADD